MGCHYSILNKSHGGRGKRKERREGKEEERKRGFLLLLLVLPVESLLWRRRFLHPFPFSFSLSLSFCQLSLSAGKGAHSQSAIKMMYGSQRRRRRRLINWDVLPFFLLPTLPSYFPPPPPPPFLFGCSDIGLEIPPSFLLSFLLSFLPASFFAIVTFLPPLLLPLSLPPLFLSSPHPFLQGFFLLSSPPSPPFYLSAPLTYFPHGFSMSKNFGLKSSLLCTRFVAACNPFLLLQLPPPFKLSIKKYWTSTMLVPLVQHPLPPLLSHFCICVEHIERVPLPHSCIIWHTMKRTAAKRGRTKAERILYCINTVKLCLSEISEIWKTF